MRNFFFILSLMCMGVLCQAQVELGEEDETFKQPEDTISLVKRQSPKKAALLSAAFPGTGQIYNKKYWTLWACF